MSLRKPKYTGQISELRKVLKSKYKRPETIERKVSIYKDRISNYKTQERIKREVIKKEKELYNKTIEKIKGKSKNQIFKEWDKYRNKKMQLNVEKKKRILNIQTGIKQINKFNTTFTNQEFYNLGKEQALKNLKTVFKEKVEKRKNKPNYILIILEGKNQKTGQPITMSDSFSYEQMKESLEVEDIIEELTDALSYTDSGANFKLENIIVRLIFDK